MDLHMKNQILKILEIESLTASELADILGVQPSNISHILSERNKPSFDFMLKLMEAFPRYNPEWLISGNGQVYKSESENIITNNRFQIVDRNIDKEVINAHLHNVTNVNSKPTNIDSKDLFNAHTEAVNLENDDAALQTPSSGLLDIEEDHFQGKNVAVNHLDGEVGLSKKSGDIKKISKVIIFYEDHTFELYMP